MNTLTIATVCGPSYEKFLDSWKKHIPGWVTTIIEKDDSKGIYEAKLKILQNCNTDYIWFVDVDDTISKDFTEWYFNSITARYADKFLVGNGCGLWNYIFKTSFIKRCFKEVEEAKAKENIKTLDIITCEDILILITKTFQKSYDTLTNKNLIEHTINDSSVTSSSNYDLNKLKRLYRNCTDLTKVARHIDYEQIKIIFLANCYNQYWHLYRRYIKRDEIEACDNFIMKTYKEVFESLEERNE